MTAAIGTLGQLGIDSSSPVGMRYDFMEEDVAKVSEIIDANGIRGTRSRHANRTRPGLKRIGGPLRLEPNKAEMAALLPWILGTSSGTGPTTYSLTETLPSRYVTIDRIFKVFTYDTVKVDVATFSARQGEPLVLTLDLIGKDETVGNAGTFPSLSIGEATTPWVMTDLTLTINAVTVTPSEFSLTINNFIDKERFFNGRTLASVESLDREISMTVVCPYGDQGALYDAGEAGVAGTAVFTNGSNVLTMTMTKIIYPTRSPNIGGRREIMLPITGKLYRTDAAAELIITL